MHGIPHGSEHKDPSGLQDRDALIETYQKYVLGVVAKLMRTLSLPSEQNDDLVGAGYLGLVEAAERYDPKSEVPFSTFAFLRIRGAIIDSIREGSYLSTKAHRFVKAMKAAHQLREEEVLTAAEKRDTPEIVDILDGVSRTGLIYRLCGESGDDAIDEATAVTDTPEKLLREHQDRGELREWVRGLPEKERIIVEEYYFNGKSFVEISEHYEGMTKSWVSRLHARALQSLKEAILFQGLKPLPIEQRATQGEVV
jgi:RNA polymerase sigma factor for flagellar operon FliA